MKKAVHFGERTMPAGLLGVLRLINATLDKPQKARELCRGLDTDKDHKRLAELQNVNETKLKLESM